MKKIGQNGPPKLTQIQTPNKIQQSGNKLGQAGQSAQVPQSFEPSQTTLASQALPSTDTTQAAGTIKAGLLSRGSIQVGGLLDGARQMMDKLDQQISWRMGRLTGQLTDLLRPGNPSQPPPIAAMYGIAAPGIGIGGDPGQVKPPVTTMPPIAAMYGIAAPGIGIGGDPGQVKPPIDTRPPIAAMYGIAAPGTGGSNEPPPIAAMYGIAAPGTGDWTGPVIRPKYGLAAPPMIQVKPDNAQQN